MDLDLNAMLGGLGKGARARNVIIYNVQPNELVSFRAGKMTIEEGSNKV